MGNNPVTQSDSPLSIISSIVGLLTFIIAISAAILVRLSYLRSAHTEYFQVKQSLNWYKTESTWMNDLVASQKTLNSQRNHNKNRISPNLISGGSPEISDRGKEKEYEMYAFVLEQLGKLEERLLELLTEAEVEANKAENKEVNGKRKGSWTLVPRKHSFNIAAAWLPVRTKALELVRQRDALGPRVLFAQLSMLSSKVQEQELRSQRQEIYYSENLARLETIITSQHEKLDKLQDLVYRALFRSRTKSGFGHSKRTSCDVDSGKSDEKAVDAVDI